jgi:hypothetical protein
MVDKAVVRRGKADKVSGGGIELAVDGSCGSSGCFLKLDGSSLSSLL